MPDCINNNFGVSVNEAQSCAILHGTGPMLVLAGPGSGKTFVLTRRIQNLIQNHHISPEQILVITFTKKAAVEMRERAIRLISAAQNVSFGTFHSCFYQILLHTPKYRNIKLCNAVTQKQILTQVLYANQFDSDEIPNLFPKLIKEISYVKNAGMGIQNFDSRVIKPETFRIIYEAYNFELHQRFCLDFDDMLLLCYEYLKENKEERKKWQKQFRYILIDEFQDINAVQYAIIKLLTGAEKNVFVVGDDDQAIYGFRGSDPQFMQKFLTDYAPCKQILLNINYRCSFDIVALAKKSIACNTFRFPKEIMANATQRGGVYITEYKSQEKEIEAVLKEIEEGLTREKETMAILYRTNKKGNLWAEALFAKGISFEREEKTADFYEEEIVKDILAYFSFCFESPRRFFFLQCMNKPVRYLSRKALQKEVVEREELLQFYQGNETMQRKINTLFDDFVFLRTCDPYSAFVYLQKKMGYLGYLKEKNVNQPEKQKEEEELLEELGKRLKGFYTVLDFLDFVRTYQKALNEQKEKSKSENEDEKKKGVKLMTYHASKGLEFDTVFLPGLINGAVPHPRAMTEEAIEEERRMFYVAMTRAKKRLYLTSVVEKEEDRERLTSKFLLELKEKK